MCSSLVMLILVTWLRCFSVSPIYSYCFYFVSNKQSEEDSLSPCYNIKIFHQDLAAFGGFCLSVFTSCKMLVFLTPALHPPLFDTQHSTVSRNPFSPSHPFIHLHLCVYSFIFTIVLDPWLSIFSVAYNSLLTLVLKWS